MARLSDLQAGVLRHSVEADSECCSPFRVPIARLAAAQAQLLHPRR